MAIGSNRRRGWQDVSVGLKEPFGPLKVPTNSIEADFCDLGLELPPIKFIFLVIGVFLTDLVVILGICGCF